MPLMYQTASGYRLKLKLFTVPGQVIHAATRRVVIAGADGVVFVANSQTTQAEANNEYWQGMQQYMRETGVDAAAVPTVVQFNKQDMPDARNLADLEGMRSLSSQPIYTAVAIRGEGVLETLRGLMTMMFEDLNRRYDFEAKFQFRGARSLAPFLKPLMADSSHRVMNNERVVG
ncbi:MAG: GTPase domain-containing protein [Myxococcota bacterium]